jgi:hypothetical protein
MRKVSASPWGLRNGFPILWFGGCILSSMNAFALLGTSKVGGYVLIAIASIGCIVSRALALRLMDEVYDNGDSLLVRRNDKEQRIYLHQINRVSGNDAWITLKATSEGEFGNKVRFVPTSRLFQFTKHPYLVELRGRIQSASNT